MYNKNPYYQEVLKNEELLIIARIVLNNMVLTNKNIKNIKYDLLDDFMLWLKLNEGK